MSKHGYSLWRKVVEGEGNLVQHRLVAVLKAERRVEPNTNALQVSNAGELAEAKSAGDTEDKF